MIGLSNTAEAVSSAKASSSAATGVIRLLSTRSGGAGIEMTVRSASSAGRCPRSVPSMTSRLDRNDASSARNAIISSAA
jgi:hypothetical protein